MGLEDIYGLDLQVCSLELSKKLEKLGMKQKSLWYWTTFYTSDDSIKKWDLMTIRGYDYQSYPRLGDESYSAWTVAEFGEMLKDSDWKLPFPRKNGRWWCGRDDEDEPTAETEADARAKLLIWLIEKEYVSVEEINR